MARSPAGSGTDLGLYQPPMLKLPWLISCKPQQEIVSCYSPFEDRFYRIRLPNHRRDPYSKSLPNGWLLFYDAIVNPISGIKIPFRKALLRSLFSTGRVAAVLPPPNFVVFVIDRGDLCFLGPDDRHWTHPWLPMKVTEAVTFGGKLYCLCSDGDNWKGEYNAVHLVVVDPLLTMPPSVHVYKMMEWSKTPQSEWSNTLFGGIEQRSTAG